MTKMCVAALFVMLSSANASVLTFAFAGKITQVPLDDVFGDIGVGDAIQGSFSFDTTAVDLLPADPSTGVYTWAAPLGMTATVGTHVFTTAGLLNIGILNSVMDQYTVLGTSASGDLTLELFLQDNTGSAFTNDHLPLTPPSLAAFAQRDFHLDAIFSGAEVQVDGQLTAPAATPTPESSSSAAVLAGSVILFVLARRKRLPHLN